MSLGPLQLWLVTFIEHTETIRLIMWKSWSWPIAESFHFLGLTLLFGSIAAWDLRLLGVGRQIPVDAFHRLVPFAVAGFLVNAMSGFAFVMTEANQYIYNPAFQLKLGLLVVACLNVLVFYALFFRRIRGSSGQTLPVGARVIGAVSLACWIGVIVCGRMITFFRPFPCGRTQTIGFLADCIMR
jgi:hypothetical protein